MGAYLNPETETKEQFLEREGLEISKDTKFSEVKESYCIVVLMDNGFFTAAGIAYSEDELKAFTEKDDNRPKRFYMVRKDLLMEVSNLKEYCG